VDRNGVIYIGTSVSSSTGKIFAINPDGTQKWVLVTAEEGEGDVTVDRSGGTYDGTIYVGTDGGEVLAFAPTSTGLPKWSFPTSPDIETGPAVSKDGNIVYILGENGNVFAINAVDGSTAWGSPPDTTGSYHDNNPVVDTSGGAFDGTIYIMSDAGYLSSVKADGTGFNWEQVPIKDAAAGSPDASMSSPAVGLDGTIYVGSDDNYLYAVNPSDGSIKWRMNLNNNVRSSPTIGVDGTIYVGSDDNKVFAINRFALPRNIKNLYVTSTLDGGNTKVGGEIVEVGNLDDWLKGDTLKGPWAIRIEVMRSIVPNAFGNFEYTLRSWVRQCNQLDCSDVSGTFYQDTRAQYNAKVPHLEQTVELSPADQVLFDRFLFGFTGATGTGVSQNAIIEKFNLSFIRPGDPVVNVDPDWP
jgi:hypothetical protein